MLLWWQHAVSNTLASAVCSSLTACNHQCHGSNLALATCSQQCSASAAFHTFHCQLHAGSIPQQQLCLDILFACYTSSAIPSAASDSLLYKLYAVNSTEYQLHLKVCCPTCMHSAVPLHQQHLTICFTSSMQSTTLHISCI